MRQIFLTLASSQPSRVAREILRRTAGAPVRWVYLGRDYETTRAFETSLGDQFERISYAQRFQTLSLELREKYVFWIADLGKGGDISWWASRIAEKNTLLPSLFHSICYLQIATELLREEAGPILVVAERESVLRAIEMQHVGVNIHRVDVASWKREELRLAARFAFAWARFLVRSIAELRDARLTRSVVPAEDTSRKPRVIIHTCIDETYFDANGGRDRYFPELDRMLREMGCEVRKLPWLFNIRRSRREAFAWFRARAAEYVIPEDTYRFADYGWSALVVMKQFFLAKNAREFEGLDVRALVRCARLEQAGDADVARFVRYDRLIRRWAARGERVDVFIDMFENMAQEKPPVIALRDAMPSAMTVGFQHYTAFSPMHLILRTTSEEARRSPCPDVIVCNSEYSRRELIDGGFPENKLRVGPSLRYDHIRTIPVRTEPQGGRVVLVVLSLEEGASRELLYKLRDAFPQTEGIEFRLKLHPMCAIDSLRDILDTLPAGFTVVRGELSDQMSGAACAVVVASTSAFELALAGIPLVVAGRESDFVHNPLARHPEFPPPATSAMELRSAILDRLDWNPESHDRARQWALRMRCEALSPVTSETVHAFIGRPFAGGPDLPAAIPWSKPVHVPDAI
jgi:hypothetical protein